MDVGPLVVLGLMWVVLNALRRAGKPSDRLRTPPASRQPSSNPPGGTGPTTVRTRPPSAGAPPPDATQREGAQLERLLRDLGRTLDQASVPGGRASARQLPPAGQVAGRGSPTESQEGRSLEVEPARGERAVVDQDEEGERVVQQRLAAAEANLAPLSDADHQAFEQRIRAEPADKTATRAYTVQRLREAIVWREILGPPVSLRKEGEE